MTTAVLRAVDEPDTTTHDQRSERLDKVTTAARQVPFGRTVLLWLASLLYLLGYGAAKVFGAVWFALVWVAMAVRLGWSEAREVKIDNSPANADDAG